MRARSVGSILVVFAKNTDIDDALFSGNLHLQQPSEYNQRQIGLPELPAEADFPKNSNRQSFNPLQILVKKHSYSAPAQTKHD